MATKKYKAVGDKLLPNFINNTRVIIYDDNNIQYIVGDGASFEWEPQYKIFESMDGVRTHFPMGVVVTLGLSNAECLDSIKLDNTLMRRIATFNKEQECKRFDKMIEERVARIKELDDILNDKEKRVEKLKKFVATLYDIDIDDDDEDWD